MASDAVQERPRARQKAALEAVVVWRDRNVLSKVQPVLEGLPVQLRTQGLGTALADLARDGAPQGSGDIVVAIAQWLESDECAVLRGHSWSHSLVVDLVRADDATYRLFELETMRFVEELKRFSKVV